MSNTLITPTEVAQLALAMLASDVVLGAIVHRAVESDFSKRVGSTINVRVPATLTARTRALDATTAIVVDDIVERNQPITLDEHAYHAARISDEDLTLRILDFGKQILMPQTTAIAQRIEQKIAALMAGLTETTAITYSPTDPRRALLAARKLLRDMGAPGGALYAVVGTAVAADLLDDDKLADVASSGTASALRDATLGRVAGFTIVESNLVSPTTIVAMHGDAFTAAIVAPAAPDGVSFGASVQDDTGSYALRWIRDYDAATLGDRSIVSAFVGARTNTLTKPDGTTAIPAIRVDTAT